MARFTTTQAGGDQTLHDLAEVLRQIDPDEPALVSLRRFDASEARRRLNLPTGRALRARFGLAWPKLCAIALGGGQEARFLAGNVRHRQKPPSEYEIRFALRAVAARLGKDTVGQTEYERERKQMDIEQRGPYRHGIGCPLPSANQILGQGRWEDMLKAADLQPLETPGGPKGTAVENLIEQFVEAFGTTPSKKQVFEWAKASGVSVARSGPGFKQCLDTVRGKLAEKGAELPPRNPVLQGHQLARETEAQGFSRARRNIWSFEAVLAGLSLAAERLPAGQSLTQDRLLELSISDPDIPSPSVVQRAMKRNGLSFAEMKALASTAY